METISDAIEAIVGELIKLPPLDEDLLSELYTKYNRRPAKGLKSTKFDTWDEIIFRRNMRKANLESELYCLRIEDTAKYLGLIPQDWRIGKRSWLDYLKEIKKQLAQPLPVKNAVTEALVSLFDMDARHYSVTDAARGDYFGYRRSSNSGRIVRFHIKIDAASGTSLPRFENTYFQDDDHWVVRGHSISVGDDTYLLGQARDATAPDRGLGLRFFVLNPLKKFGWWSGLLSSMDRNEVPIASRIVLIPVDQHVTTEGLPVTDIMDYISKKDPSAEELAKQIVGSANVKFGNANIPAFVMSLIWNGSLRTLHCGAGQLPQPAETAIYERLFAFQKLALSRHPITIDDVAFFAGLFNDPGVWTAVHSYLTTK